MAKDPICGMTVSEKKGLKVDYKGQTYYFCSEFCKNLFAKDQERYCTNLLLSRNLSELHSFQNRMVAGRFRKTVIPVKMGIQDPQVPK